MSSKKLLSEMFGLIGLPAINRINEDEEDDAFERAGWGGKSDQNAHTNSQLGSAKSVAGQGRGPQKKSPFQDVANSLNGSKSIFDEDAGGGGITLSGDKETLGAMMECLQEAEHAAADPDHKVWAGKAWKAIAAGIRGDGNVTLPKFESAPEDLMPDEEPEEGDF